MWGRQLLDRNKILYKDNNWAAVSFGQKKYLLSPPTLLLLQQVFFIEESLLLLLLFSSSISPHTVTREEKKKKRRRRSRHRSVEKEEEGASGAGFDNIKGGTSQLEAENTNGQRFAIRKSPTYHSANPVPLSSSFFSSPLSRRHHS